MTHIATAPSRRNLLGALAGLGAAGAALYSCAAPAHAASGSDAKLIALGAEMDALYERQKDWNESRLDLSEDEQDELLADFWDVVDEIEPLRAATPEGVKVKARTLRAVVYSLGAEEGRPNDHMHALVRDVLGEA